MNDKKISELNPLGSTVIPDSGLLVPVAKRQSDGVYTNYYVDLAEFIKYKFEHLNIGEAIVEYFEENPIQGSGGGAVDLVEVNNRIANLEMEVGNMKQGTNWPKNTIRIIRGGGLQPIDYDLPAGYGDTGITVPINDSQATLPNFYVVTSISNYTLANETLTFSVTCTIQNYNSTLQLNGGTIGNIVLDGTFIGSNNSNTISARTISTYANTALGNSNHEYRTFTEDFEINVGSTVTSVSQINIRTIVSGKEVSQQANRLQGGTSSDGAGFITL